VSVALFLKTLRDSTSLLLVLTAALLIFEPLIVLWVSKFAADVLPIFSKFPFIKNLVSSLVGSDLTVDVTPTSLATLGLAHPFLFAVTWAYLVTTCTRVLAGEFDRGTADLLLTLPISRRRVWVIVTLGWVLPALLMTIAAGVGLMIGNRIFLPEGGIEMGRLAWPLLNLFVLLVTIGAITMLCSAIATRRGQAVAWSLGILLFSFVLNFIVALIPDVRLLPESISPGSGATVRSLGYLGLLQYYRPLETVRIGAFPSSNIAVLLSIAVACWTLGAIRFNRRDIPAA